MPGGVDAPGGVGDYQCGAAQQPQHPGTVGHILVGVALIVVHPALHDGHLLSGQSAEYQLALVAGGGGDLEVGDLSVGDGDGVFHHVAQEAQAGAQDHGHVRGEITDPGADIVGALFVGCKGIAHKESFLSGVDGKFRSIKVFYTVLPEKAITV